MQAPDTWSLFLALPPTCCGTWVESLATAASVPSPILCRACPSRVYEREGRDCPVLCVWVASSPAGPDLIQVMGYWRQVSLL